MKREEIEDMSQKFDQVISFEKILKNMKGSSSNCCWRIETPNEECNISNKDSRQRLKEFLQDEIDILKGELSLED